MAGKKVKRGVVMIYNLRSYLISILVPASPSDLLIWERMARPGNSAKLGKFGSKQGLFGFFAFFSKAAVGGRWVGGASRKP